MGYLAGPLRRWLCLEGSLPAWQARNADPRSLALQRQSYADEPSKDGSLAGNGIPLSRFGLRLPRAESTRRSMRKIKGYKKN